MSSFASRAFVIGIVMVNCAPGDVLTNSSATTVGVGLSGVPTIRRILSMHQRPLGACLRIVRAA